MKIPILLSVAYLMLGWDASFAQNAPTPSSSPNEVTERAEILLDKARELSDIRATNAPAFKLKATFSFIGARGEKVQGTYVEVWASKSQWRRETVVNDDRRIEVGGAKRTWSLDNTQDFPEQAVLLPCLLELLLPRSKTLQIESISERPEAIPPVECVLANYGTPQGKLAFCFDKKEGLLLERALPGTLFSRPVEYSCDYGSFRKTGEFLYPREMACFENHQRKLDVTVTDISPEPSPDPVLFVPPPGALELGYCSANLDPPRAVKTSEPKWPGGPRHKDSRVILGLVVDTNGLPQNLKVVGSAGASLDQAALAGVRQWRFRPATCDGEPMPASINVQIDFRLF